MGRSDYDPFVHSVGMNKPIQFADSGFSDGNARRVSLALNYYTTAKNGAVVNRPYIDTTISSELCLLCLKTQRPQ